MIILIIVFIILVNISIGFIVRFSIDRGPFRTQSKLSYLFNDYFIKDIGNPPDTIKAKSVLNELGLNMRYETSKSGWASSIDVPSIKDLSQDNDFDSDKKKFSIRTAGRLFEILKLDDGYIIFMPPNPRDDINIERAIIPLILVITLLATLLYFSLRWIFGPIKKLSDAVEQISAGNFDTPINIKRKDEIGNLADSINGMQINISNMIKAKETLMIDVSHELRSPLTRIKLANEFVDDEKIKNKIKDDIKEMEAMITELLGTYRMDSIHEKLNIKKEDIVELINNVVSKFGYASVNTKSDFIKKEISLDKEKIETALRNIFDNAIKYSNGKPVEIRIYENPADKNETSVSIKDKGKGISDGEINKIFEPFYRVDKSRDKKISGYGLGLSIVKKILDRHNSQIEIRSRPGEGTEFIINFKNQL
ncbi:MAG: HAMP domain-containing sensor histidine kinase [bacterium]